MNVIVGMVGGLVAGWLFPSFLPITGIAGAIVQSAIGAIIVLAVAENGRATAIGYQRFPLKGGVESLEIPLGETLARGAYTVHVDAVAEVPEKDAIYHARLQTKEAMQVTVGP